MALLCLGFPLQEKGSVGSKVGTLSCCLAYVRCQSGAGDTLRQLSGPSLPTLIVAVAMDKLLEVGDAKMTEVTNDFVASKPKTTNEDMT